MHWFNKAVPFVGMILCIVSVFLHIKTLDTAFAWGVAAIWALVAFIHSCRE